MLVRESVVLTLCGLYTVTKFVSTIAENWVIGLSSLFQRV